MSSRMRCCNAASVSPARRENSLYALPSLCSWRNTSWLTLTGLLLLLPTTYVSSPTWTVPVLPMLDCACRRRCGLGGGTHATPVQERQRHTTSAAQANDLRDRASARSGRGGLTRRRLPSQETTRHASQWVFMSETRGVSPQIYSGVMWGAVVTSRATSEGISPCLLGRHWAL